MGLPKLGGLPKKSANEEEKQKKQVVFKNTTRENDRPTNDTGGFKINNILKNAREQHDSSMSTTTSSKQFSNSVKTQLSPLTPLKNDIYEKAKVEMNYQMSANEKKRKMQKLNPIVDNRRNL